VKPLARKREPIIDVRLGDVYSSRGKSGKPPWKNTTRVGLYIVDEIIEHRKGEKDLNHEHQNEEAGNMGSKSGSVRRVGGGKIPVHPFVHIRQKRMEGRVLKAVAIR